jgi:hypothetical protein
MSLVVSAEQAFTQIRSDGHQVNFPRLSLAADSPDKYGLGSLKAP